MFKSSIDNVLVFDTGVSDLNSFAREGDVSFAPNSYLVNLITNQRDDWSGYKTLSEVLESFSQVCPWVKDVEKFKDSIFDEVVPPKRRRRKRRTHQETGDELNEIAWVTRRPDGWERMHRETQDKTVVKVAVNCSISSYGTQETFMWKGAAATAISDILTMQGRAVEIHLLCAMRNFSRNEPLLVLRIPVKKSQDPFDISTLSNCLVDIAFFRLVCLSSLVKVATSRVDEGLGYPMDVPSCIARDYDFVIDSNSMTRKAAIEIVTSIMSEVKGM